MAVWKVREASLPAFEPGAPRRALVLRLPWARHPGGHCGKRCAVTSRRQDAAAGGVAVPISPHALDDAGVPVELRFGRAARVPAAMRTPVGMKRGVAQRDSLRACDRRQRGRSETRQSGGQLVPIGATPRCRHELAVWRRWERVETEDRAAGPGGAGCIGSQDKVLRHVSRNLARVS